MRTTNNDTTSVRGATRLRPELRYSPGLTNRGRVRRVNKTASTRKGSAYRLIACRRRLAGNVLFLFPRDTPRSMGRRLVRKRKLVSLGGLLTAPACELPQLGDTFHGARLYPGLMLGIASFRGARQPPVDRRFRVASTAGGGRGSGPTDPAQLGAIFHHAERSRDDPSAGKVSENGEKGRIPCSPRRKGPDRVPGCIRS